LISTQSSDPTEIRNFEFEIPNKNLEHIKELLDPYHDYFVWSSDNIARDTVTWKGYGDRATVTFLGVLVEQAWDKQDHGAYTRNRQSGER